MTTDTPHLHDPIQPNAVSVYNQDALDDFPVLKAFQQYIDAEQEKARKRMVSLCLCFSVLIALVIAVFLTMLFTMSERNQTLNDRLVEYAINDRDRAPAAPSTPPANDAALKAVAESLAALQKQIATQNENKPAPAGVKTPEQLAFEEHQRRETEKLNREKKRLEEERKKLAEEKERLRRLEVEHHRRRLYPEYYNEKKPTQQPTATEPKRPADKKPLRVTEDDIAEILREVDGEAMNQAPAAPEPAKKASAQPPANEKNAVREKTNTAEKKADAQPTDAKKPKIDNDGDAIEYFKEEEEYKIPVNVKGKKSNWRIPLN
jgi:hypothetical protein